MAQSYAMPPDTNEEENIVGGVINKHQLIWLVIGGGVGAFTTLLFFKIIGPVALIFAIPPILVGCVFAFKRVENMSLAEYLRYKRKFNKATKNFVNKGNHKELEVFIKEDAEDIAND